MIVSFERTGSSVVRPPGRGARRTLIAIGPRGVNSTPNSYVTPGHNSRVAADVDGVRSVAARHAAATMRRARRSIDPGRG
jgi:hypothetical protein